MDGARSSLGMDGTAANLLPPRDGQASVVVEEDHGAREQADHGDDGQGDPLGGGDPHNDTARVPSRTREATHAQHGQHDPAEQARAVNGRRLAPGQVSV